MTDDLTTLLQREATTLPVPGPDVIEILHRGQRLRRRRRAVAAVAVAVAAAVAVIGTAADRLGDDTRALDPAAVADFHEWGAVAVGRDVYIGAAHVRATGDISAMYYSAEGVVIRSGGDYQLVRADGEVSSIDVDIPDRVPGFEPDSTRFAYAEASGTDRWEVVVHDVVTDEELARVEVAGPAYGGWAAPPVAIDGDLVWIHLGDHWVEVDWRTGATRDVPGTGTTHELANGAYAVQAGPRSRDGRWEVRSWVDGSLIGTADLRPGWYAFFSPDGRYLRAFPNWVDPASWRPEVFEPATGRSRAVPYAHEDFGWTPAGDLLVVDGDELRVCPPISGPCASRPFPGGAGDLRIGGNPYES